MSSTIRISFLPGLTLTGKLRNATSATTLETLTFSEVVGEAGEYTASTAEVSQVCTLAVLSSGNKVADTIIRLGADAGTYRAGLQSTFSSSLDSVTTGAIASNAITAAAIAADAVTEIQAGLALAADLATVDAVVDAIKTKTDQLTFTVANQVDANSLTGGGMSAADIRTAVGLASANLDTQLAAIDDAIDTEVGAIKAKTDNLPSDPADQSAVEAAITAAVSTLATSTNLSAVLDNVNYCLTALTGACADAGTAAETYTLTVSGATYTVDHTGLDSTGNRGTVSLSKV